MLQWATLTRATVQDACGEKLSALASAASSTANAGMPGLFGRMLSAIPEQQVDGRDTGELSGTPSHSAPSPWHKS